VSDAPDFSPLAGRYASGRPSYPPALFAWLAERVEPRRLAWDAATGNGQAATGWADHFEAVVATDRSAEQIGRARPHPRIEYRVAASESSGLAAASVDLASVAAALHWFDLDAYFAEVRRVVRPGGLFTAWTYHAGIVGPPLDELFDRFYWKILKPHFAGGADLVDDRYETIAMPGAPIATPEFRIEMDWTMAQVLAYVESWSAVASYRQATGEDPVALVGPELERIFRERGPVIRVTLPLFLHARRL